MKIDSETLKKYTSGNFYPQYEKTVDIQNHLEFHFDGFDYFDNYTKDDVLNSESDNPFNTKWVKEVNPYYQRLVDYYRPGEDKQLKVYRRIVYKSVTKRICSKVV